MPDSNVRVVKEGDKVKVNYVGLFEDGSVFDTSEGNRPLEFTVGAGEVIPGFDQAVIGLKAGESCKIKVAPEDGYGPHVPEMIAKVERTQIPGHENLLLGSMLEVSMENGSTLEVQVVELTEASITLDANHPLAGKELLFEIELLELL